MARIARYNTVRRAFNAKKAVKPTPTQRPPTKEVERLQKQKEQFLSAAAASTKQPILSQTPVIPAKSPLIDSQRPHRPKTWYPLPHQYLANSRTSVPIGRDRTVKRPGITNPQASVPRAVPRRTKRKTLPLGSPQRLHARLDGIETLQKLLGLGPDSTRPEDAIFIALDAEFDPAVCQLGLCIMDTRSLSDLKKGHSDPVEWMRRMHVQDCIYTTAKNIDKRSGKFWFGTSRLIHPRYAISAFQKLLISAAMPRAPASPNIGNHAKTAPKVVLVGHGLFNDVTGLERCRNRQFSLLRWTELNNIPFTHIFDTLKLAVTAREKGTFLPGELSSLLKRLGVGGPHVRAATNAERIGDPWRSSKRFYKQEYMDQGVPGRHNAGNDAAYCMVALLELATRWEKLIKSETVCPATPVPSKPEISGQIAPLNPKLSNAAPAPSSATPSSGRLNSYIQYHPEEKLLNGRAVASARQTTWTGSLLRSLSSLKAWIAKLLGPRPELRSQSPQPHEFQLSSPLYKRRESWNNAYLLRRQKSNRENSLKARRRAESLRDSG